MVRSLLVCAIALLLSGVTGIADSAAPRRCQGEPITIRGTSGADRLIGTSGRDVIAGFGGNDTIRAGAGDDVICGGAGADQIFGGPGADRIDAGDNGRAADGVAAGDQITPGSGDDTVVFGLNRVRSSGAYVPDSLRFTAARRGVRVDLAKGTATGEGTDQIHLPRVSSSVAGHVIDLRGTNYSDRLIGSDAAERLSGNGGSDFISGAGGEDRIEGGAGNDRIRDLSGRPGLWGGAGNDRLVARWWLGREQGVHGGSGLDSIRWTGFRTARGEPVTVNGQLDLRQRTATFDYSGATYRGVVDGLEKFRLPPRGSWQICGTSANEYAASGGGRLVAAMGGGNDVLIGSRHNDVLHGGPGYDTASGRDGRDRCEGVEAQTGCELR
ncbi:MAG TPA: calcium-binding protein [Marmoricola sp.]|nr:calcium-binding protein [Marmoricola sp.]